MERVEIFKIKIIKFMSKHNILYVIYMTTSNIQLQKICKELKIPLVGIFMKSELKNLTKKMAIILLI